MEFTAKQISEFVQGNIEGDENASVNTFAKIEESKPGAISFLSNPKYTHFIYETKSSIVLIDESVKLDKPVNTTLIRVKSAYEAIARLLQLYESMKPKKTGIDSLAFVSPKANIGKDCYIGAFAYIGDNVEIADGFGFAPNTEGYAKIPQIGIVTIEDNVEIGANTCVDRSTMGSTYLRKGVKLDNLVQIAHNTDVGENTVMSAQVGVAGSTKIGAWCMFGGQVGIAGHSRIGDKVFLGAQSGVPGSLKDNQTLIGTPPMEPKQYFKSQAIFRKLPDLYRQINALQKEVEQLKELHKQ